MQTAIINRRLFLQRFAVFYFHLIQGLLRCIENCLSKQKTLLRLIPYTTIYNFMQEILILLKK